MPRLSLPPPPPDVALPRFDDNLRRIQFRLWQIVVTIITIAITVWFMTLGILPAILALMVAKHVLVAVLAMGLHLPDPAAGEATPQ
jgi:hypothetical protein